MRGQRPGDEVRLVLGYLIKEEALVCPEESQQHHVEARLTKGKFFKSGRGVSANYSVLSGVSTPSRSVHSKPLPVEP